MSRLASLGALAALGALLGASGCSTYKYFDINVRFDSATFDAASAFRVQVCNVTVTGSGDNDGTYPHDVGCPNETGMGDSLNAGTFEFSTLADSGNITFKVSVWNNINVSNAACKMGEGSVTLPVTDAATTTGTINVVKMTDGC